MSVLEVLRKKSEELRKIWKMYFLDELVVDEGELIDLSSYYVLGLMLSFVCLIFIVGLLGVVLFLF